MIEDEEVEVGRGMGMGLEMELEMEMERKREREKEKEKERGNEGEVAAASLSFPLARVKKIMKMDRDIGTIQNEALLAVTAAAEVFLEQLTAKTATISDSEKRKTVTYRDVANTVANDSRLFFLQELVPKTIPLAEALENQRKRRIELGEGEGGGESEAGADEDSEHPPSGDVDGPPEDMDDGEERIDRTNGLDDAMDPRDGGDHDEETDSTGMEED